MSSLGMYQKITTWSKKVGGPKKFLALVAGGGYVVIRYLNPGDKYEVLESDGDAILIDKLGDTNSPYFVSANFLRLISDFK